MPGSSSSTKFVSSGGGGASSPSSMCSSFSALEREKDLFQSNFTKFQS
jgi:hypothetical protein